VRARVVEVVLCFATRWQARNSSLSVAMRKRICRRCSESGRCASLYGSSVLKRTCAIPSGSPAGFMLKISPHCSSSALPRSDSRASESGALRPMKSPLSPSASRTLVRSTFANRRGPEFRRCCSCTTESGDRAPAKAPRRCALRVACARPDNVFTATAQPFSRPHSSPSARACVAGSSSEARRRRFSAAVECCQVRRCMRLRCEM
jgi:hypothetical protein